jgi:hypothetical protein
MHVELDLGSGIGIGDERIVITGRRPQRSRSVYRREDS